MKRFPYELFTPLICLSVQQIFYEKNAGPAVFSNKLGHFIVNVHHFIYKNLFIIITEVYEKGLRFRDQRLTTVSVL